MGLFFNWKRLELSLLVGLSAALLWGVWAQQGQQALADKVVRMHILANSDAAEDQALKLQVRDAVLERTEAILRGAENRAQAERGLQEALGEIETLAEQAAAAAGHPYPVTAELRLTQFPTRKYGSFALPAGEYLALRLVIGAGEGHNWWCVVFPPLCSGAAEDPSAAAMAAGLNEEDVQLVTERDGYVIRFKSIELWEGLKERLGRWK